MALFFYRTWAGSSVAEELNVLSPIYYTRWGYAALLGVTMVAGLALNSTYLLGYLVCPRAMLQVPHIGMVGLAIRDLLVCLLLLPAAIDWLVVGGQQKWSGGSDWCSAAVFFDYTLNAVYPLILISVALILYTRKIPPPPPPSREPSLRFPSSRMSQRSGYTQRTQNSQMHSTHNSQRSSRQQTSGSSRPPSVNNRPPATSADFRRGFSKSNSRENSILGSERGSVGGGRGRCYNGSQHGPPMRASSPLSGVQEEEWGRPHSPAGTDLWDLASLDYPGREDAEIPFEEYDDEPRLREWLWLLVPLSYLLALGFGIPAATVTPAPGGVPKSPGCYVTVVPSKNYQYSSIQSDPGVNLVLSSVVLTYLVPMLLMFLLSLLLCTTRWTKDGKLNRFYKMCIALCIFFMVFKSPIDIIQFRDLLYALEGGRRINPLPNEIEQEVLLVWCALLPVVGNPLIYLTCVSDYRDNIKKAWRMCTGKQEKGDEYLEGDYPAIPQEQTQQYLPPPSKETQESDVL